MHPLGVFAIIIIIPDQNMTYLFFYVSQTMTDIDDVREGGSL